MSPTGSNAGSGSEPDPLKTIQEAVNRATPGTTIMVEAGNYVETVKFDVSGLPDAPISLISADGPGAAKIIPDAGTTRKAAIAAFGEENVVIRGFDVSGGGRLESNPDYYYVLTIAPDNCTPPLNSKNILLKDNTFARGEHWLQVLLGHDVGLQFVNNRFDNVFQGATGPHSGDLDYDLAWLPNNGDRLYGTPGNDTLDGGDGADTLSGGAGNDTYIVDNIGDLIEESPNGGVDTVISSVAYTLGPNVENLALRAGAGSINATGNELANVPTGNEAGNVLNGGLGADRMVGGKRNDAYYVDTSSIPSSKRSSRATAAASIRSTAP